MKYFHDVLLALDKEEIYESGITQDMIDNEVHYRIEEADLDHIIYDMKNNEEVLDFVGIPADEEEVKEKFRNFVESLFLYKDYEVITKYASWGGRNDLESIEEEDGFVFADMTVCFDMEKIADEWKKETLSKESSAEATD